ncbi:MAG: phosphoribosylformylglycinamidine cyclo-ligase [Candidatus Omnitrophica bacterium]|nr:phosphoribosylformylglycinamidine cyclo-ligase [Candidatus Omnitrophota bacterium]
MAYKLRDTSRRNDAGAGRRPPSPGGLDRSAAPRGVARRSRTALGTLRSSRLARLAARSSAATGDPERRPHYAGAGVSLARAGRFLRAIEPLVRLTRRPGQVGAIGGFGGVFDPRLAYRQAGAARRGASADLLLVSSTDGVGTKLALARRIGRYDGLGVDLVAMNVNDVVCTGAEPWFFLDYLATGRIDQAILIAIMRGVVRGCCEARCALVGGETAEMPLVYRRGEFDLAGFCVGAVSRRRMITGAAIRPGDAAIGLASTGFHANGYTLIQRVLSPAQQRQWAAPLLAPTKIYVAPILALLKRAPVHGIAHITGGAFQEKLGRILPAGTAARLARGSWPVPAIFRRVQRAGGLAEDEMYRTFNMGIGMIVVVPPTAAARTLGVLHGQRVAAWRIGTIEKGRGKISWA